MANKTIEMSKIRQIFRMYAQGTGKKQISSVTGIARNTVKKYLQRFGASQLSYAAIDTMTDHELDRFFAAPVPEPPDARYAQLLPLLPEFEKQL